MTPRRKPTILAPAIAALLIASAVVVGPSAREARAATCAGSIGPGIPPPAEVSSGIPGFHAQWYGQSGYPTLCPGQRSTATVAYYNSGSLGWVADRLGEAAYLGTWGPEPGQDQPSALGGDGAAGSPSTGWPRYNRVAIQPAPYVGPGQVAWFQFTIQAPATPGHYRLYLRPLVEGASWMEDVGVFWRVTVLNADGTRPPLPPAVRGFEGVPSPAGQWHADDALAVGPSSVVMVANSTIAIRDKSGTLTASKSVTEFFNPVRSPGEGVGDPWVLFDPRSERFLYVADGSVGNGHTTSCAPGACIAHHLLAVSKGSSPQTLDTADWNFWALDRTLYRTPEGIKQTANWGDFDSVVVDDQVVVIKWPAYAFGVASGAPGQSQGVKVRILDKKRLLAGDPITEWTDLELRDSQTGEFWTAPTEPAIGSGGSAPLFLLSPRGCGFVVWAVEAPLTAPSLRSRELGTGASCRSAYGSSAVQPGGLAPIDVVPYGHNVVYRSGSLWYAHVVAKDFGSGPVSAVRWIQIDVSGWPNSLRTVQDAIFGDAGVWYFAPAIMLDTALNVAIVMCRSSATEFPSLYYTYRLVSDGPGTLRPATLLASGTAGWTKQGGVTGSRNRYVDFTSAALDPSDGSVWMFGPYVRAADDRGTWVANLALPRP